MKSWINAFEESFNVSSVIFIGMFIWLCVYGGWLYDVVSYEVYDLITYGCIGGLTISVVGRTITWILTKIVERKEKAIKATIDPFVIG